LSKNCSKICHLVEKFESKNAKFNAEKCQIQKKIKKKITILSTPNLLCQKFATLGLQKFAASVGKYKLPALPISATHNAAGPIPAQ